MCMCILHAFKSTFLCKPVDYSTKSALIGFLNEVRGIFG